MISNSYWDNTAEGSAPVLVQVSASQVSATAPAGGYLGTANLLAPYLETKGDFGVVAAIQTAPGIDGLITLTGSLDTGTQYWQGNKYAEFGVDNNGNYVFAYWDGTSSNPALYQTLKSFTTPPTSTVTMELLRQQGQFFLYFNGVQFGPIADPGLFNLGIVIPGFVLFPGQQMKLTQLAFEVPATDTTTQAFSPVGTIPYVHPGDSLASLATVTGRNFGVGLNAIEFASGRVSSLTPGSTAGSPDYSYAAKVVGEFNLVSAATMYYFDTEAGQGDFTFGDGDAMVAAAAANGMQAHCHHLIGPNIYLPGWIVNGNFTAAQLTQIMTNHIQTVVGHFKGKCASWDVVNEALNMDGTISTTANIWAQTIGATYIDLAFQTAHQADPNAKLFYNDYYIENQTAKTPGLYSLVAGMKQRGTPIDGVGLQAHWIPGNADPNWNPIHDSMVANMAQLANMGLLARISEMDARLLLPATSAALTNQATIFATTVQACLDSPNCIAINQWDGDDATSWIPAAFPGYGAATMFDTAFQPKPGYTSAINTLRSAALNVASAPKLAGTAIVNAASYANQGVAPGEIVTIFASNVGPAALTGTGFDAGGKVLTEIAGTRVLFDGIAAPMAYAAKNQLAAVVPYEIAGETSTLVQVEYNGVRSVAVSVPVVAAIPGIITANSQGTGQAVAVNQDGTLNSAANPAARGTVVILYATGEGQRSPAGVTGLPSPANDEPVLPAALTVGAAPATLAYAASAPGFVGLMQVNFTVPQSAPTGAAAPLILTIGNIQSPSGVTIAVK